MMMRSTTRWLWAGALLSSLAACSPPATTDAGGDARTDAVVHDGGDTGVDIVTMTDTGTDSEPSKDVVTDTGPADTGPEDTGPGDAGKDSGPADTGPADTGPADTGPTDTGPADTGPADTGPMDTGTDAAMDATLDAVTDVAMDVSTSICTGAINLNTAGTLSGETTSYTGSNSTAPTTALVLPVACTTNTGAQVAHTYTTRNAAALRINTIGSATDFDTVALAVNGCTASSTEIGCNDDASGVGPSQFTTALLPAGSTVVILVGGYNATTPATGNYVLNVVEVPSVPVGGACDPAGTANFCEGAAHCITSGGASTCVADGALGGRCRSSGTACDAPNACSGSVTSSASRCVPVVAPGGTCDPATTAPANVCDSTSHCITSGGASTCVVDGALGGRCRATGTACDAPNACSGSVTSSASRCVPVVAPGGTCDPATTSPANVCDSTSHCITSGGASTCVVDGALGGRCRATGTACDAPNTCNGSASSSASRCVPVVALGGTCDPARVTNVCASGSYCRTSGGTSTCAALPYTESSIPTMCADLSTTAVDVPGSVGDDANSMLIALPAGFAFSFFGTPVDNYSVASNGFLQLWSGTTGTPTHEYANAAIPTTGTPNNFLAPFWDDLVITSPASVRTATLGAVPNRTFVVEWNNVTLYALTGSVLRFQVQLFETTGVIEYHYCTMTPATDALLTGSSATVGLENATGTLGIQHSYSTANRVSTANAIRFTPNP